MRNTLFFMTIASLLSLNGYADPSPPRYRTIKPTQSRAAPVHTPPKTPENHNPDKTEEAPKKKTGMFGFSWIEFIGL